MKCIECSENHLNPLKAIQSLKIVEKEKPQPGPGEVLVKMEAAPCNPSDILFLQGLYGVKKTFPAVPGWEGAGTVVASGGGLIARWLVGKRVACGGQAPTDGTWAEYYVAKASNCIPLKPTVSFEQGATLIINPITAYGLVERAKIRGSKALIQTAGASQVGRMVQVIANFFKLPLISIVRRDDQKESLKKEGAEFVINSSYSNWTKELSSLAKKLNATTAFDAIGGSITGDLLRAMPPASEILVYGALSLEPCSGIDATELIFHKKSVRGFWLTEYLTTSSFFTMMRASNHIQNWMGSGIFQTKIQKEVGFEEFSEALLDYQENMTAGKVILKHDSK